MVEVVRLTDRWRGNKIVKDLSGVQEYTESVGVEQEQEMHW